MEVGIVDADARLAVGEFSRRASIETRDGN
jgi:hypothetical protein